MRGVVVKKKYLDVGVKIINTKAHVEKESK